MSKNFNLKIPENMPTVMISGGTITSTDHNIRLIVYDNEINKGVNVKDKIEINKIGKTELVMSPNVAKIL